MNILYGKLTQGAAVHTISVRMMMTNLTMVMVMI